MERSVGALTYGEDQKVAAELIQRCARKFLAHTKEGSIVFRRRGPDVIQSKGRRGLPIWLEDVMDDTRRPLAESALGDRLEAIMEEFTRKHVGQPQEAEVMHRLCGSQYMARRHPAVPPNPTALGPTVHVCGGRRRVGKRAARSFARARNSSCWKDAAAEDWRVETGRRSCTPGGHGTLS